MRNLLQMVALLMVALSFTGCGIARMGELQLLAEGTAPPDGKQTHTLVRTLIYETTPRIDFSYNTPRPMDELVTHYKTLLPSKGWTIQPESLRPDAPTEDLPLVFVRSQARLELSVKSKTSTEESNDAPTEVFIRISTHHFWDFVGLDWIQGAIWAMTGFSEDPSVEAVVQVF